MERLASRAIAPAQPRPVEISRLVLETTFLIDLERESRAGVHGAAGRFLEDHGKARFYITVTIAGEFAAGPSMADRSAWEGFLAPFHVLPTTIEAAWHFGRSFAHLRANGTLIGTNDLWIAATALAHQMPVVTRNTRHYRRVPGLEVVSYER